MQVCVKQGWRSAARATWVATAQCAVHKLSLSKPLCSLSVTRASLPPLMRSPAATRPCMVRWWATTSRTRVAAAAEQLLLTELA